jgi:hypothetical protein
MSSSYNFSVTQGSEVNVRLTITNDGSAVNLSGYNVRGKVKGKYGNTGALIDLDPTIVTGTNGALYPSGYVDIYLSGSQTAGLPVTEAVYDLERFVTGTLGAETSVIKMLAGKFTINPEVTNI